MNTQMCDERVAARIIGISVSTIRQWRARGRGPQFVKIDDSIIRYPEETVREFAEAYRQEIRPAVVAESLGVSIRTLARWRAAGKGPAWFVGAGGLPVYRSEDYEAYVESIIPAKKQA